MNEDPLAPARGCCCGTILAGMLWVAFFGGLAVIVARCL